MNRAICTSLSGRVYVADYLINNRRREPIRVYVSKDLQTFETVWEFPPGDIRHIHALIPDPEDRERIWVLGGWSNNPSKNWRDVWYSKDGKNWTELTSDVIWQNRHEHSVVVFQDKLWLYGGYADVLTSEVWTLELPADWGQD